MLLDSYKVFAMHRQQVNSRWKITAEILLVTILNIMIHVHERKEKINQIRLLLNGLEQFFDFDEMPLKIYVYMHQLTTCTPYGTIHAMQSECSSCK